MPANIVKTGQEPEWNRAKDLAAKYFKTDSDALGGDQFALVTYLFKRLTHQEARIPKECEKNREAINSLVHSPVLRPGKKESSIYKKHTLRETMYGTIEASTQDDSGRKVFPVVIISQGMGNLRDRNYYTDDAIQSGVKVYNGKKAYYDHPTETQEKEQPGRSVREVIGHYENVRVDQDEDGLAVLKADLVPIQGDSKKDVVDLLEHSVAYKKKFPDQEFIGVSINGDGEGESMDYDDFLKNVKPKTSEMEKIQQVEGQKINVIKKLTDATSADLVTEAGAGGRILKEKNFKPKKGKIMDLMNSLKKLLGEVKTVEGAVKDMLQDEKKETAGSAGADSKVKSMLQAYGKVEKKEDEDEKSYQSRCMKAAYEAMMQDEKKEKKEDEDEHKDEKKEKHEDEDEHKDEKKEHGDKKDGDDHDGDDKEDEKKEKKEDGDDDGGDDGDHKDKKQDVALIKKMMKQVKDMQGKMEKMQQEMEKHEDEKKESQESAFKLKTELDISKRKQLIEDEFDKNGIPRSLREGLLPILKSCKTDEEVCKKVKEAKEFVSSTIEKHFEHVSNRGLVERAASREVKSTDELFE